MNYTKSSSNLISKIIVFSLTLLCLLSCITLISKAATIKGKIFDRSNNEPLVEASVYILHTTFEAASDVNGNYQIDGVPAGHYTIEVKYIGYITYTKQIDIKKNQSVKLDIGLQPNTQHMKSIAVFGKMDKSTETSSRLTELKSDNEVNVIGSSSMVSSPDINAANVLQRLSGVTLQKSAGSGESYSIIRGMEPRYNNTLIDGIKIPSPNDKSRFVSLNIIPSD
ncbi:MAG TPA: carboxypeptidase-like regulatory domain-containing protein, partial [Bacteroidales bacterium]|nr:carboxypeptidase-like regulatory domain-containing protein [Bacteroidales bacterium]